MVSTETHIKEGAHMMEIQGFWTVERRRQASEKKGGGLAIAIRKGIQAHEWERRTHLHGNAAKEILWVIIRGPQRNLALGTVYIAVDSERSAPINDKIYQILSQDIDELREQENEITIMGDFQQPYGA